MNRLAGWLRMRYGLCRYGPGVRGCWREPDGTWHLNGAQFRLCSRHWHEVERAADDFGVVGTWVPE